jgi:hypothetical protein
MTMKEAYDKYNSDIKKAKDEYCENLKQILVEYHLDGLVRRKKDGKIGWVRVNYTWHTIEYGFYPRTKKGTESERQDGYISMFSSDDLREQFEPVEE